MRNNRVLKSGGLRLALAAGVALLGMPVAAHADGQDDKTAQLQMQIDALQKQINDLKPSAGPANVSTASNDGPLTWKGITIFGVYDVGATYMTHGAPLSDFFAPGVAQSIIKQSTNSMFSASPGNMSQSKIGVKGEEDVANGFKGLFLVETYFQSTSGQITDSPHSLLATYGVPQNQQLASGDSSKAGQAFGQAYAGVKHATFGTLTFGRQTSVLTDETTAFDPLPGSQAFSPMGYSGVYGGGGGDTSAARMDSLLKYDATVGMFHLGGMYQLEGNAGTGNLGTFETVAGASYGGLSVDLLYGHIKDAISFAAASATSMTGTVSDNTIYAAMAKYAMGPMTYMGGYQHITYANPAGYVPSGSTFDGYLMSTTNNVAYNDNKQLQFYWLGGKYQVTSKMTLAAAGYHLDQNMFNQAGIVSCAGLKASDSSHANCKGAENWASLAMDYKWTARIDTYAGLMYSHAYGGIASGFFHDDNINPTVGVRYAF